MSGTPGPIIGPLSDDKNIFVLGAELRPFPMENSINKWKLWITKKQDYETSMMREYRFSIIGGAKEYPITLTIENIDDNSPIVRAKERNCTIEVRILRLIFHIIFCTIIDSGFSIIMH